MELRHLRYFCAVAEHQSFTKAANQLHVSQSGVSGQVRDLEREIGVKLFRRNRRAVSLSPEGILFWNEAREILARADRAVELTKRSLLGQTGKLTVGLCGPVTSSFLPGLIQKFRKQFPGVTLTLRDRAPSEQVDALISNAIDLGFTRGVASEVSHLVNQELVFREQVVVAVPRDHPFAKEPAIPVRALATSNILIYGRENTPEIFDGIVAMCKRARFTPRIVDTPRSWQTLLTMVEAGEGVGLVPECAQHLNPNRVIYRPISGRGCRLNAIVIWRRGESAPILEHFLELIRGAAFPTIAVKG
jgi:DNA-binding transcriptional LysR family regulator